MKNVGSHGTSRLTLADCAERIHQTPRLSPSCTLTICSTSLALFNSIDAP